MGSIPTAGSDHVPPPTSVAETYPLAGRAQIRSHRHPRRRTSVLIAALAISVAAPVGLFAPAATTASAAPAGPSGRGESASRSQDAPADAPAAAGTRPTASKAGPWVYGLPQWLPLRRDLSGTEIKVGCTFASHGSSGGYECSGHHDRWAIDFIAERGSAVFAAGAGFATNVTGKPGGSGFGNVVRIDHGFGISTVYAHLSSVAVPPEGAWVDETTQLGTVGSTGSSSTPHLHFERFALPTPDADIGDQISVDPGPLWACRSDLLVSFPEVGGFATWKGLAWGSLTVANDGHDCVADAAPASPAVPVPSTSATAGGDDPMVAKHIAAAAALAARL